MRPGRLEVVAFGPFADRQVVDIDSLGELGLFVIAGPTGSGKTSLFDAMCYALYGELPGARSSVRRPRSDHAAPSVRSEVIFDFDAAGERWRVRRRPAHLRAKKRGTGTIEDPADAVLYRLEAGGWQGVTTRAPEVDARCIELVGLDADQFQRVVLLPQGRFQQLLHARSIERRDLLRTLFASETFEQVERRLIELAAAASAAAERSTEERQRQLAAASAELDAAMDGLGAWDLTAAPASASDPDPAPDPDLGTVPVPAPVLMAPVAAVGEEPVGVARLDFRLDRELDPALAVLAHLRAEAREIARAATEVGAAARQDNERLARHAALKAEQAALESERQAREQVLAMIEAAQRARPVVQAEERVEQQRRVVHRKRVELAEVTDHLQLLVDQSAIGSGLDLDDLDRLSHQMATLTADLTTAVAETERARCLDREHELVEDEIERLGTRESELTAELDRLLLLVRDIDSRVAEATPVAARMEVLAAEQAVALAFVDLATARDVAMTALVESATTRRDLDGQLAVVASQVEDARQELAEAQAASALVAERTAAAEVAQATALRRTRLGEVEADLSAGIQVLEAAQATAAATISAFVAGAARRLAATLVEGEPCPVCGSCDHPHAEPEPSSDPSPAQPVVDRAIDRDEDPPPVEVTAVDRAHEVVSAAVAAVAGLQAQQQQLLELLGADADRSVAVLDTHAAELAAIRDDTRLRAERGAAIDSELSRLEAAAAELTAQLVTETERSREIESQITILRAQLGDHAALSVADVRSVAQAARAAATHAQEATARLVELGELRLRTEQARAELDSHRSALSVAVAEQRVAAESLAREAARVRAAVTQRFGIEDPTERLTHVAAVAAVVDLVGERRRGLQSAERILDHAEAERDGALAESGYESLMLATEMARPAPEIETMESSHARWSGALAHLEGGVASLEAQGLPEAPHDLAALAAIADQAENRVRILVAAEATALERRARIDRARQAIDQLDRESGPSRRRAELLHQVAEVCRGRNIRNTSLEAWVLSSHLREVVAQANVHLTPMTGGRFRLAVADEVVDRRALAGLDLEVDDDETGCRRPTSTLSGGETFQASLALALGLADVVTAGASGIRVDAVFIDEGFGSLDPESLDLAIDTLDRLRTRGALVGVVTHVEALKQALPVGVEVVRRRDGTGSVVRQPGVPGAQAGADIAGAGAAAGAVAEVA